MGWFVVGCFLGAICLVSTVAILAVAAYDKRQDRKAEREAEEWCRKHVDPYVAAVLTEDFELWSQEMQS